MTRLALLMVVAACGGGQRASTMPSAPTTTIGLQSFVAHRAWYVSPARCGQGPYDIVIPASATKWGEQVDLVLSTKHGVALHAVLLVDGAEVARTSGTFDMTGANAQLDNTRCLADKRVRVAASRTSGGGGGGGGTPVEVGVQVPSTPAATTTAKLELETGTVLDSTSLLTFKLDKPAHEIVLRLWSVEPNDLEGVRLGVLKLAWRPNVPEAEYEAHLVRIEAERVAKLEREAAERARKLDEERRRHEERAALHRERLLCRDEARRRARGEIIDESTSAHKAICRSVAAEDEARRRELEAELVAAEQARLRAIADRPRREAEERRAREEARRRAEREALEAEQESARRRREAEEEARAAQLRIALEIERKRKREQFCAAHPDDRGCWGAGGMAVHLQLEQAKRDRAQFCLDHKQDVRCWSGEDWKRRRDVWNNRIEVVLASAKQPDGPPPAPRAEEAPPKLSVNAEWRPGYWHWLDGQWIWLAGQWNVPEADLVAEQTTTAPVAPPPLRVEVPPPPPVVSTVWVAGFWQWNGASWVWIAGSYQLRPTARMTWRAPEWRARGRMHVLVPGGWIRIGGSR
ncbi:MAG TPA: hypothetical protein VIV11_05875 [Kofleriaceae bacterium]